MTDLITRLDDLLAEFVSRLEADPVFGPLIEGTISRPHLIALYTQIWHCLGLSAEALRGAGDSMALYGSDHPAFADETFARFKTELYQELAAELREHGSEETGHDDWMLDDLVGLGVTREEVLSSKPGPAMAAYLAGFRQAAVSVTPAGVAGQAYILEGISELRWGRTVENLVARSGIPNIEGAVSCLGKHAIADIGHGENARRRLRRITDPRDQAAILHNARLTIETWGQIGLEALRREALSAQSSASAGT